MTATRLKAPLKMSVKGFVCGPPLYKFNGWLFEFHAYLGPWPLTKDLEPRKRAGKKFYRMIEEFDKLTEAEKKQHRIGGGCQPIG